MSEQRVMPEVLPGDLITRVGLYETRCLDIVPITGWKDGWWITECDGTLDWYGSDGHRRFYEGPDADRWQLLHWVGPLPASEPEPETTTEQLAEIEGQADYALPEGCRNDGGWSSVSGAKPEPWPQPEPEPVQVPEPQAADTAATEYTPPDGWRLLAVGELVMLDDQWVRQDGSVWRSMGTEGPVSEGARYIRRIEPQPIQVREGRWRTRAGDIRNVTPTPADDSRAARWPWRDAKYDQTWREDGGCHIIGESPSDLVEYLGPIEPKPEPQAESQPQPVPESDAELRIRLLKEANDSQAETIGRLLSEARDLNMEIGGLERQLLQRDARIRDLETMHAAASQAVVDAGKQNDALRLQVQNRQQEYERQKGRIEFLETLNAGNGAAISDYKAQVEKLQGLVDTARGQLEAAATERDELRAAIDAADKQLDQKDAQIRDLRIELDAAQQVQQPMDDDEREQIWDEATEAAGRQVMRWLRPLTLALNRQPDERFSRFMALTLSVLPDVLPELLGYAVADESDCEE